MLYLSERSMILPLEVCSQMANWICTVGSESSAVCMGPCKVCVACLHTCYYQTQSGLLYLVDVQENIRSGAIVVLLPILRVHLYFFSFGGEGLWRGQNTPGSEVLPYRFSRMRK